MQPTTATPPSRVRSIFRTRATISPLSPGPTNPHGRRPSGGASSCSSPWGRPSDGPAFARGGAVARGRGGGVGSRGGGWPGRGGGRGAAGGGGWGEGPGAGGGGVGRGW